jgi:F-type H+-transporting ATPase subunit a
MTFHKYIALPFASLVLALTLFSLPAVAFQEKAAESAHEAIHDSAAHAITSEAPKAEAAHAEGQSEGHDEKFDIVHHIANSDELDFEPFGKIHLPKLAIGDFDISITRDVVMMWIVSALLLITFTIVGNSYKKLKKTDAPKGIANAFEALVDYVRTEVVRPNIGAGYEKYMPYMLTVFFFILFCNLLGLIPYGATATANINVTLTLAVFTFLITQAASIASHGLLGYVKHLTGGTHWLLWFIMVPVEFIGLFTKPFALMIRLFANMTAGHAVILSLLGLIFILKSFFIAPISIAFALFIYMLELFVAFLQAYIFTMLSSLFIGMATAHEHDDAHAKHDAKH